MNSIEAHGDVMPGEANRLSFDHVTLSKWQSRRMPLWGNASRLSRNSSRRSMPDSPDPSRERMGTCFWPTRES